MVGTSDVFVYQAMRVKETACSLLADASVRWVFQASVQVQLEPNLCQSASLDPPRDSMVAETAMMTMSSMKQMPRGSGSRCVQSAHAK